MKKESLMKMLKKRLVHSYLHLSAYVLALLFNRQPQKKFVLFFRPRSGSNLLVSLLNAHPDIHCDGEIFVRGKQKPIWPSLFLKGQSSKYYRGIYGFKLNIGQIMWLNFDPPKPAPEPEEHKTPGQGPGKVIELPRKK